MWTMTPGEINDRLMLLGAPQTVMYLVKGARHMLIGGGGQWSVPELERQFHDYRIDVEKIEYVIIGHSHYDHCGAIPYLIRRYPHLKVLASAQAEIIFGMEKAQRNMRNFSRQAMIDMGLPLTFEGVSLEYDKIHVHRALSEGDLVDLGDGICFRVIETPGHSRCSISLYEPHHKWLFPSDSMAFPVLRGDGYASTASESFIAFLDSLKKLAAFDTSLCAWEHFGVMTDNDAKNIVRRNIRYTLDYKRRLAEHVDRTGDLDETARWAAGNFLNETGFAFLAPDVIFYIQRVMAKNAVEEKVNHSDYL